MQGESETFIADEPFLFFIREKESNAMIGKSRKS